MNFDLIYPAILVFLLMAVGVVMTIIEFKQLEKEESDSEDKSDGGAGRK